MTPQLNFLSFDARPPDVRSRPVDRWISGGFAVHKLIRAARIPISISPHPFQIIILRKEWLKRFRLCQMAFRAFVEPHAYVGGKYFIFRLAIQ